MVMKHNLEFCRFFQDFMGEGCGGKEITDFLRGVVFKRGDWEIFRFLGGD